MKLKFKPLYLESGRPIAFVSDEFAEKSNTVEGKRIEVIYKNKKITLAVNLVEKLLSEKEISFSDEAISQLGVKKGASVDVTIALEPRSTRFILKKLNGSELSKKEIHEIIKGIVNNSLNEAEIAYFVSGVYNHGMTFKETVFLTESMAKTGVLLKWKNRCVVDKHSIGGIPGNRTTPIVVSICAAAGLTLPKTSSRAITSAAGTADTIETIANVCLSHKKLKQVVQKTNACLAWGGSLGLAPADDKLIRVERLLNVDPESQLLASIISKKISAGSNIVLIDIPYGEGAKVSLPQAKKLKAKFLKIAKHFKLKLKVVLTLGDQPIGNGIGPVLEIIDVLKVLERKNPPTDLEEKSVYLASEILELSGRTKDGKTLARELLNSGKALEKFNEIISAQGRKKSKLQLGKFKHNLIAKKSSKIKSIHNKKMNLLARKLGCPTDKSAGICLHKHKGDKVTKGETILTLYSESKKKLNEGLRYFKEEKPIHL